MRVEFVSSYNHSQKTGIGRYMHTLKSHLEQSIEVSVKRMRYAPLSGQLSILRNFPLGIEGHQHGSIVHIPQIMGSAVLLRNDYTPCVATVHDLGVLVCPEDEVLINSIDRWILDLHLRGLQHANHVVVNSPKTKNQLVEALGLSAERIHYVQLGVDADVFRPIADSRLELSLRYPGITDNKAFTLIYVGSELPRKKVDTMLEAMAIVKKQGQAIRLLKVGSAGGNRWRQETISVVEKLNLYDEVLFLDIVPEEDLPLLYNLADCAITATALEGGFAWVAMEAMACGKPVVATEAALIPNHAEISAIVVPDRNAVALADAILKVATQHDLRQKMEASARESILKYSWESTAQSMQDVYLMADGLVA